MDCVALTSKRRRGCRLSTCEFYATDLKKKISIRGGVKIFRRLVHSNGNFSQKDPSSIVQLKWGNTRSLPGQHTYSGAGLSEPHSERKKKKKSSTRHSAKFDFFSARLRLGLLTDHHILLVFTPLRFSFLLQFCHKLKSPKPSQRCRQKFMTVPLASTWVCNSVQKILLPLAIISPLCPPRPRR